MADDDEITAKRPTIYDLAQIAGTSASAVSSVLNGTWKKRRISARLAERISRIAEEQGYAVNLPARMLRRERSRVIGMIIPKYDNRYFGAIAERFETMARERGLFPVITCTQREPALEVEAARETGGRELVSVPLAVPGRGGSASGSAELATVTVR